MGKPLLVGEANPISADPYHALYPWPPRSAGARLAKMMGLTRSQYLRAFARVNLFAVPPARWRVTDARMSAAQIHTVFRNTRTIVLLGARVAAAFRCSGLPPWGSRTVTNIWGTKQRLIRLPHPSGRCRTWNDPLVRRRMRRLGAALARST